MNFKAEAEGVTPDQVTEKIIEVHKSRRTTLTKVVGPLGVVRRLHKYERAN